MLSAVQFNPEEYDIVIASDILVKEKSACLIICTTPWPDVSAKIANYLWYANANEAAREFTNRGSQKKIGILLWIYWS